MVCVLSISDSIDAFRQLLSGSDTVVPLQDDFIITSIRANYVPFLGNIWAIISNKWPFSPIILLDIGFGILSARPCGSCQLCLAG